MLCNTLGGSDSQCVVMTVVALRRLLLTKKTGKECACAPLATVAGAVKCAQRQW